MDDHKAVSGASNQELIEVEVAVAWPELQILVQVKVPKGSCVADAIAASGLAERYPELEIAPDRLGVFAELRRPDDRVQAGDRVEIYRPLKADPKEIRRQVAEQKAASKKSAKQKAASKKQ